MVGVVLTHARRFVILLSMLAQIASTTPASAEQRGDTALAAQGHARAGNARRAASGPMDLDLSSASRSLQIGSKMLQASTAAVINVAGAAKTVEVGSHLTAAELVALHQVVSHGNQTLVLDADGRAVGGTFNVRALPTSRLNSLVIPAGVVAFGSAGRKAVEVSGVLSSAGTLLGVAGAHGRGFGVRAGVVNVNPGGSITTQLPDALQPVFGAALRPVNLSIASMSDIINSGAITSSGQLNLRAAGIIVNALPTGRTGPSPVISGALGTNLFSGDGRFTNSGAISSRLGSVSFNTALNRDLVVDNTGGSITATVKQSVNFRDSSFAAKNLTHLFGGQLIADTLNFLGGDGLVKVNVDRIDGLVNVHGGSAHVYTADGQLSMGKMELTGDPTIANQNGDVTLTSDLVFHGQDLAILARGNVVALPGVKLIDLSGGTSTNGGDLTVVAGFNFGPAPVGSPPDPTAYLVSGASSTGGAVRLAGVQVNTSAGDGHVAGNVTIVSTDGSNNLGTIAIGGMDASSGGASSTGGSVRMFGPAGIKVDGSIKTTGSAGGSVQVYGMSPLFAPQGPVTFRDGTLVGGSFFASSPKPGAGAAIHIAGGVTTSGLSFSSGDVMILSDSSISLAGGITTANGGTGSGAKVTLTSSDSFVFVGSHVLTGGGSGAFSAGNGGNISISARNSIQVSGNLVTRGGDAGDVGNGGNAGSVSLSTGMNTLGPNARPGKIGAIELGGFIDARGGTFGGRSSPGQGGLVELSAGTVQVKGVDSETGASINATGTDGSVKISTFGFQPLPSRFDLTSSLKMEYALPGGLFAVGNADVNGTGGTIMCGSDIANTTNGGRLITSATFGSITIVPQLATSRIVVQGAASPQTISADNGAGVRTRLTPGEALALFATTRSLNNETAQNVGVNASGQVVSANPWNNPVSIIKVPDFEIIKPFSAFKLETAEQNGKVELNISGNPAGSRPILIMPRNQVATIAGTITFSTDKTTALVDLGARPLNISSTGAISAAGNHSSPLNNTLILVGSGSTWTNNGKIDIGTIRIEHTGKKLTFINGATGAMTAGSVPALMYLHAPGQAVVFRSLSSQMPRLTVVNDPNRFPLPTANLNFVSSIASAASVGFPTKLALEFAPTTVFPIGGVLSAGAISIKVLSSASGAPAEASFSQLLVQSASTLTVVSPGKLSFTDSTLASVTQLKLQAPAGINFQSTALRSQGTLDVSSKSGDINTGSQTLLNAYGGSLKIAAGGNLNIGSENQINCGGDMSLSTRQHLFIGSTNILSSSQALSLSAGTSSKIASSNNFTAGGALSLTATGNSTIGYANAWQAEYSVTVASKAGTLTLGDSASISSQTSSLSVTAGKGQGLTLGALATFTAGRGNINIAGTGVVIGRAATFQAGELAEHAPPSGTIDRAYIVGSGSITITSGAGITVDSTDIGSVSLSSVGRNTRLTALGGNILLGSTASYQSHGGNLVILASGQVIGSSGNGFLARATGSAGKALGGGIEIGSGLTKSGNLAAALKTPAPVQPTQPLGTKVFISNNQGRLLTFGSGNINLTSSGLRTAKPILTGGAIVIDAVGPSAGVQMDGGSFVVSGFLPIAYWTDLTLPDLNADQDANGFDELSVRSDDVIAHLTKRVDILIENNAEHVFDTPARLRLSRGRMFLHALEDVTVVTPAGEVHAKKRALFSVEVRSGTVSVRACSGPGHVSFIVCGQKLCVDPGREMLIADHMPAEQETLPADGVGRRNIRSRVLADGITVTTSDFSLVSMVNSRQHLAQLKCSASAGHILKRLVKTAAALELLSSSKGRYTARPVLDAPEGSDGPYRTVADRTSL